jgi:hypothetical protein
MEDALVVGQSYSEPSELSSWVPNRSHRKVLLNRPDFVII